MQLKRIKKIKSIGLFFDCNFADIDFPKMTLIYGLNGYGKSTLSDIFRSLSKNDASIITSKQTIHHENDPECELCFSSDGSSKETNIYFKSKCWDNFVDNIKIFDSHFVSENVYSDFEITHKHKEKISTLILGEDGSVIAKDIEKLEKEKREARKEKLEVGDRIKNILPREYADSIENFISIGEDRKIELEEKTQLQKKLKTITEKEVILKLEKLKNLQDLCGASAILADIEAILLLTPGEKIDKEAVNKTQDYISRVGENSEQWFFQGLEYHKDGVCPFCTQNTDKVSDIIFAYKNYFSDEYKTFVADIKDKLNRYKYECVNYFNGIEGQALVLSDNLILLNNIKDFISSEDFIDYKTLIDNNVLELKENASKLLLFKERLLGLIDGKIKKKIEQPLVSQDLNEFDRIEFVNCGDDLAKKIIGYNEIILKINEKIENLKTISNNAQDKFDVEQKIKNIDLVEIRFSASMISLIKQYEEVKELVSGKEKEREEKEKELIEYNKQISDKILEEVNSILRQCGCRYMVQFPEGFSKRGYSPVLEIGFKLFEKDFPLNKFGQVLSDSDKRMLAFSFFVAQLNVNKDKLKDIIVVLDDPFTSFDDNRIEQIFSIIKEISNNAKQLIILSHYGQPLALLSDELNGHLQLKIKNSEEGSSFEKVDLKTLFFNQHEMMLDKLDNAISGVVEEKDVSNLKSDLRTVIEHEIKTRYRQQLKNVSSTTLGSLIDEIEALNEKGKVNFKEENQKVITELRDINSRTSKEHHSNPSSQIIQISTPEGLKTTIKNAFDLIYTKL